MATTDTDSIPVQLTQIDHACGHRFLHLIPRHGEGLLELIEALAVHSCPACAAGLTDWTLLRHPEGHRDATTEVC